MQNRQTIIHKKPYGKAYHTCGKGEPGRSDVNSLRIHCFNSSSDKPAPMIIYNFTTDKRSIFRVIMLNTWCVHSPQWLTDGLSAIVSLRCTKSTLSRVFCEHLPAAGEVSTHSDDRAQTRKPREILSPLISLTFVFVCYRESIAAQLKVQYERAQCK